MAALTSGENHLLVILDDLGCKKPRSQDLSRNEGKGPGNYVTVGRDPLVEMIRSYGLDW